jgi:uncharacterized protein
MLIVLSPAKSLDYETPPTTAEHTLPQFVKEASALVKVLKQKSPAQLSVLMGISDPLAALNAARFGAWSPKFSASNAKQAALAFDGDVYGGLDAPSLTEKQLQFAQQHVRILSGLYGVLRPLDWMQPYRLEMGTPLENAHGKDLYAWWGAKVTDALNAEMAGHKTPVLVNLASNEYFKVVKPKQVKARIVTPTFEEGKGGQFKVVSFFAKRARGLMARYAITHKLTHVEKLKAFNVEGYAFAPQVSGPDHWVFRRTGTA